MKRSTITGITLTLALVAACGVFEKDVIIEGERLNIRDGMAGEIVPAQNVAKPISLGAAQVNADWTHRNGGPAHQISHPALAADLTQVFAVSIGEGNSRRARITADPVVAGGVIYTMDAGTQVTATGTDGAIRWTHNVRPAGDNANSASGGGLAVSGGKVFVASGFGELTALDAATGAEVWIQNLNAAGGSAPTVQGGLVYLVSRDSRAWAIDTDNGRIRWTMDGTPSPSSFSGGAGVAATPQMAVFPFPSGEVMAAFPRGGLRRWSSVVTGQRLGLAASNISDISGDPVISGNRVFVGNVAGRVVALDLTTGDRLWTAIEGSIGPVWPAGGSVFLVNDLNELVRLDAATGQTIWRVAMPHYVERRIGRRTSLYAHYGPIIAGGRLIVASSDGLLRQFDPVSGALVGTVELPGGASSNPVVAGGVLYVVNNDGKLLAFR